MPIFGFTFARATALLVAATIAGATPILAQSVVAETPGSALSRQIRVLAANPRDFNALIGAGRAALELGDVQAAAGFFGRAEEVNPNAPAAKAGLGAAMAHMGDADGAIFYFDQALKLGAQPMTVAADRGMARDLLGELGPAQADYRLAIASLGSDEARRRLALSLAIARDRKGALDAIQPLLNRRDPAAQRTRAFVLALTGDQIGAAQAIESMMPGGAARFAPFFRYLPNLSTTEKAAAVHLGIFPENAGARIAQVEPVPQPAAPTAVSNQPKLALGGPILPPTARPAPDRKPPVQLARREPIASKPAISFSLPSTRTPAPAPGISQPAVPIASSTDADMTPVETGNVQLEPAPVLAEAGEVEPKGNLSGIDKLLATIAEPPPPAQPRIELKRPVVAATSDKATKAAAAKKAAEKKAREEKLAAEKKAREEAAKLGIKGTYWVQLAGGSNQDRMTTEYRKLSAKAGKLLKSRTGYVTGGKDYFRLLVGPFDSKGESQTFVNKLEKEGVDGFSWTRTPPKIRIEKLSAS